MKRILFVLGLLLLGVGLTFAQSNTATQTLTLTVQPVMEVSRALGSVAISLLPVKVDGYAAQADASAGLISWYHNDGTAQRQITVQLDADLPAGYELLMANLGAVTNGFDNLNGNPLTSIATGFVDQIDAGIGSCTPQYTFTSATGAPATTLTSTVTFTIVGM